MSAPKGNQYAKGKGNPGRGSLRKILENVKKHQPLWWKAWEEMMNSKEERRYAMSEFNKMQTKLMPTVLAGDDESPVGVLVKFLDDKGNNNRDSS